MIRALWRGETVNHRGPHYRVENARIYSCPPEPPPIYVSGFGPKAVELAARIGDGYVTVEPDAEALASYRKSGGEGPALAGTKVCYDRDESAARKLAVEVWPTTGVPGALNQELPSPAHFEQAAELVTEELVASSIPCGPDPERHAAAIRQYFEAGFDEVYVSQVGEDQAGFLRFFFDEVKPRLGI